QSHCDGSISPCFTEITSLFSQNPNASVSTTSIFLPTKQTHTQFSRPIPDPNVDLTPPKITLRVQHHQDPPQRDPIPPATEFHAFTVEDRPGEQWITLRGKFGENETIKIEATISKSGDDSTAENVCLHISLLVDISKGEECDLEFVCSAWPDSIEIQKVYIFRRDGSWPRPYMGPNFRDLDKKLQNALFDFLKARGVNDDLSVFLHEFMMNKDRSELIQWLTNAKSFVEK
ncbi:hypothetical protein HYC85_027413, partial [Camellia sinensis]